MNTSNDYETLIIIPYNAKGWATLIDFSFSSSESICLADLSYVESFWPLSRGRKLFQRKIAKLKNFEVAKYRRNLLNEIILIFKSFFAWKQFRNFGTTSIVIEDYDVFPILHCRISAFMGDRFFDRQDTPLKVFRKHYMTTHKSIHFVNKLFNNYNFSRLAVYNGREPLAASAILVAKKFKSRVLILERGSSSARYQIFKVSPHFHPEWWELITNYQPREEISNHQHKIDEFIKNKLIGIDTYFGEFWNEKIAKSHNDSKVFLPKKYVSFFTSSSTEFSPFDEYNSTFGYVDQYKAVEALLKVCVDFNLTLVVRRHPNSIGIDGVDREKDKWKLVLSKFENVVYLGPEVKISSYDIASNAQIVYVWKSSIGFETLALGKPTYALGPAKWAWDAKVQVWTQSSIEDSLKNPICHMNLIVHPYAQFMTFSGSQMSLFKDVQKWGFITAQGITIRNTLGERIRRKSYDFYLKIAKKRRKRNA